MLASGTHEKLAQFPAGKKPHGIAFAPDGTVAYVTDEEAGTLLAIDIKTRAIASQLELGGMPNGILWLQ